MNEDDTSLDEARWTLLQWVLDLDTETILNIQSSNSSKYIRIIEYTLKFLHVVIIGHFSFLLVFFSIKLDNIYSRQTKQNHHISTDEDVIIRRTELDGQRKNSGYKPKSFCPPPSTPAWRDPGFVRRQEICTVHKYTVAFETVCHCLEICGLRKETVINCYCFIMLYHDT